MNRPARISLIALGLGLVLAVLGAAYWVLYAPDSLKYSIWIRHRIRQGNRVAHEIDAYRQRQGHLPASLEDVGEPDTEEGPIYYKQCSDTRYILWFGTTLGHSMSWDSAKRSWVSLNLLCPSIK
jgi:hypothetical protein